MVEDPRLVYMAMGAVAVVGVYGSGELHHHGVLGRSPPCDCKVSTDPHLWFFIFQTRNRVQCPQPENMSLPLLGPVVRIFTLLGLYWGPLITETAMSPAELLRRSSVRLIRVDPQPRNREFITESISKASFQRMGIIPNYKNAEN